MTEDPLTEEPSNQPFDRPPQAQTDPPPTGAPLVRRLRRRVDGSLGGVAGGVADYLKIDPAFVRIAFVLLAIVGSGGGILLYLAAWVLLPDQTDQDPRPVALNDSLTAILGGGLLVLGALSATFGSITLGLDDQVVVPLAIAGIGFYLLNQRADAEQGGSTLARPIASPAPPADPRGLVSEPTFSATPVAPVDQPVSPQPPASVPPSTWAPPTTSEPTHWATPVVQPTVAPAPPKPPVTSVTLAIAAVVAGALLVIGQLGAIDIGAGAVFGAFATICGLGLIASAFIGRARPLIPIGLISLLGLGLAPVVDTTVEGGLGPREYVVTSEEDLRSSYEVGGGTIELDLRRLTLTQDRTINVEVGAGAAEIWIPRDTTVQVNAESEFGVVEVFGREQAGVSSSLSRSTEAQDGDPTLTINVTVTFGAAEVHRG